MFLVLNFPLHSRLLRRKAIWSELYQGYANADDDGSAPVNGRVNALSSVLGIFGASSLFSHAVDVRMFFKFVQLSYVYLSLLMTLRIQLSLACCVQLPYCSRIEVCKEVEVSVFH
jgi:hypothetical protein